MIAKIRRLWDHARWADELLRAALSAEPGAPPEALREFAHILGADEVWLSRLEGRALRFAAWPDPDPAAVAALTDRVHYGYATYLASLGDADLSRPVRYTTSAGASFENTVGDILLHAAMHGQYHRGKVNLLLRQAGRAPAPVDYIAFIRGAAAATAADARRGKARG